MTTQAQQLKKELTQVFPELKFSVKTKMVCKGHITEITVTVKGLQNSDYTVAEVKEITNKYHNWDWRTVTGDTNVVVNADKETKEEINNPVIETIQETKEEPIDDTVVEIAKEVAPQNKVAKLQIKLTCLNAQLSVTKGNRNKAKLVLEILKVESAIEQLEPIQEKPVETKKGINQLKPVDVPVTKKDEFCKKPEKATIKFLESKFKDAQIEITDKQVILKSETSELKLNCFVEIPYIDEYYNHYRRKKLIKRLRDGQTSKAHSVCEYIGSILLAA